MPNKIHHLKLDTIDSTQVNLQSYLRENNNFDTNYLTSAIKQSSGRGRGQNSWVHFKNSLAFSFTLTPNSEFTLTSLEVGVILSQYIEDRFQIRPSVKWTNDIFNKDFKKIGGILINNSKRLVVGVGINWGKDPETRKEFSHSQLFPELILTEDQFHSIPLDIYNFILSNRINSSSVLSEWTKRCCHIGKEVMIKDEHQESRGIFKGIGSLGEALLHKNGKETKVYSGNLFFI